MRAVACAAGLMWAAICVVSASAGAQCCGDCDGDGAVSISEVVTAVDAVLIGCPANGPCCGDCNGSGDVSVNEVITAVANALDGCPKPPPTCPIDFTVQSQLACSFSGRFNANCGGTIQARLVADSGLMLVSLNVTGLTVAPGGGEPIGPVKWVFVVGELASEPTFTSLLGWYTQIDDPRGHLVSMHGSLELANGQRSLRIQPTQWNPVTQTAEPSFDINGCRFEDFEGTLVTPQQ